MIKNDLFEMATSVSQSPSWFTTRFGAPRLMSVGVHGALIGLALIPWTSALPLHPKLLETAVVLYTPTVIIPNPLPIPAPSVCCGRGCERQPLPALCENIPRAGD